MKLGRHWEGHFVYREDETDIYPIEATLELVNGRLTGTMIDSRLEVVTTVADILEKIPVGTPLHEDWLRTAEHYPDLVYVHQYPRETHIRGRVRDRKVSFTKVYPKSVLRTSTLNDCEPIVEEIPTYPVSYIGELDSSGSEIVGTWTYATPGIFGFRTNVVGAGSFRLICQDETSDSAG